MVHLLWDASAWVKRYCPETGSATVLELGRTSVPCAHIITVVGYAETHSILVRRRNSLALSTIQYRTAAAYLETDVLTGPGMSVLDVLPTDILDSIVLIRQHSLNASDASILVAYHAYAITQPDPCILVAADRRLCRAAQLEGIRILNPEAVAADDVDGLLSRLA